MPLRPVKDNESPISLSFPSHVRCVVEEIKASILADATGSRYGSGLDAILGAEEIMKREMGNKMEEVPKWGMRNKAEQVYVFVNLLQ